MAKNKEVEVPLQIVVYVAGAIVVGIILSLIFPSIVSWLGGLDAWLQTHFFNIY